MKNIKNEKQNGKKKNNNNKTVLAACDTFRAAAIDQLENWSKKVGSEIIKSEAGSDPASVAFKAMEYSKKNKIHTVLIDTAGRLQNKKNKLQQINKQKFNLNFRVQIYRQVLSFF